MKLHEVWNINAERIESAANTIAEKRTALKWLEEFGVQLDGSDNKATVLVAFGLGRDQPGADEAAQAIASCMRLLVPDAVTEAIACCTNDIDAAIETIRAEIKMGVP